MAIPAGLSADPRQVHIRNLLIAHPGRIALDPAGEPVLRGEFLALDATADGLVAIDAAGFDVAPDDNSASGLAFGLRLLRDRLGRTPAQASQALRAAAPGTEFAYQHIYLQAAPIGSRVAGLEATTDRAPIRVGLVDSGVDGAHRALTGMKIERHGCGGRSVPTPHGTVVATRLAGGATGVLYVADLWCGDPLGRGTLGLVEALAWMGQAEVGVINISLVGPHNPVLARAVQGLQARGHVVVAAAGNDGPAAPALYPAAYPGVIGVGAVDDRMRPLPESASGPHVDYVARGVVHARPRAVRGTSFAAPLVARMAAREVSRPDSDAAARVKALLDRTAISVGRGSGDLRVGSGLIAADR